jgi:hypothetical protein
VYNIHTNLLTIYAWYIFFVWVLIIGHYEVNLKISIINEIKYGL